MLLILSIKPLSGVGCSKRLEGVSRDEQGNLNEFMSTKSGFKGYWI